MQDAQQISGQAEFKDEPDKLFGVCLAVGEHLHFNPFYLRLALIALAVPSPAAAVAAYVSLATVVLVSHMLFPQPDADAADASEAPVQQHEEREQLPLAA